VPRVTVPREGTTMCAGCRKPRGNTRRGWAPILHGAEVVGFTCPDCPEVAEPIRRMESTTGVRFRAVVDATPRGAVQRRQVTRTLPTLEAARAFVAEVEHVGAFSGTTATTWTSPRVPSVAAECRSRRSTPGQSRRCARSGWPKRPTGSRRAGCGPSSGSWWTRSASRSGPRPTATASGGSARKR
jgi:hypothetical protein